MTPVPPATGRAVPQSKRHPARRPQQRSAKPSHQPRGGRPRSSADVGPVSPARRRLEIQSAGPLVLLHRLPRWLVPALMAVLLVAGLALPPWGGVLLLLLGAFLCWLLALSWPVLSTGARLLRLAAVLIVLGAGIYRLTLLGG